MKEFLDWLELRGLTDTSLEYYKWYVSRFFEYSWINSPSLLWDRRIVEDGMLMVYRTKKKDGSDITQETKKKYIKVMRVYSDFLLREWIISANVSREIKTPRANAPVQMTMADIDVDWLITSIRRRWKWFLLSRNEMIVKMIYNSWLRRREIVDLQIDDVIFENTWKEIYWKIHVKNGKWRKERFIYLSSEFSEELHWYLHNVRWFSEYVFPSYRYRKMTYHAFSDVFRIFKQLSGARVYAHLLRHTYASRCIRSWVSIETVRINMGHSSLKTTSRYVVHNPDEHWKQMEKLKA